MIINFRNLNIRVLLSVRPVALYVIWFENIGVDVKVVAKQPLRRRLYSANAAGDAHTII